MFSRRLKYVRCEGEVKGKECISLGSEDGDTAARWCGFSMFTDNSVISACFLS